MEDIDDDFGDLYADVEFQASTTINGRSNDDFSTSGLKEFDELIQRDEAKTALSECGRELAVGVDNGSDSEDDLNIVLNDDNGGGGGDGPGLSRGGLNLRSEGFDEDQEEHGDFEIVAEGDGLVKNRNSDGQSLLSDGLELSPNGCRGGGKGNGSRGSYRRPYLPYKYTKHCRRSFPKNSKADGFMGLGSYSSTSVRGDWDDNKCSSRMDSSSLTAQIGHKFSLPRNRTILDVSVDAFERKPWRHPGADITDYFNFELDEESWKLYCNSVDQFRQHTSLWTRTPTYGYSKAKEVYEAEAEAEYETGAHKSRPESFDLHQGAVSAKLRNAYGERKQFDTVQPKGRVIQVEDSILERHPSMDLRRVVDRDPDVVIQIAVQDCVEDSSVSGKEESTHKGSVREASENEDFGVDGDIGDFGVDGDIVDFGVHGDIGDFGGGSGDELSGKLLERDTKRSSRAYPKRYSQVSTTSSPVLVDFENHASGQISDVDGCCGEKVTGSSSEGQTEAMETSINKNEKVCSETCNAALSLGETESLPGDDTQQEPSSSISGSHLEASENFASADPERCQNYPRKQSPNSVTELQESLTSDYYQSINSKSHQEKTKTRNGKYCSRNKSPFPTDWRHNSRRLHNDSELKRDYDYQDSCPFPYNDDFYYERLQGFDSYYGGGFPYYGESELPPNYFGKRFSYNQVHAAYSKRPCRNHLSFGNETDQYPSRRWEERAHFHEQRGSRLNDEAVGRDWHHKESRITLNTPFRNEPRQLGSNYSSYSDKERHTRWRGKGDKFHFRKRVQEDGYLLDSIYEDDFVQEKYGYCGKERKYLHGKYERHWPSTRRGQKIPSSRCNRGPRTANRGRGFDGKHRWRQISKERSRGRDYFGSNDGGDSEGRAYYPDHQVHYGRKRHWQYDSFAGMKNENNYNYSYENDEFLTEETSFPFGRTVRNKAIGGKQKLMDNEEVEQHRIKVMREGSSNNCIERSSNITDRANLGKPLLMCKDSVDLQLVGGEGKSSGRCSNAGSIECDDTPENMHQMISEDHSESHAEEASDAESPEVEINQNEETWLDKFPITEQDEALDIEEGQIVTEEANEDPPCANFGSENVAEIGDDREKCMLVENATDGNKVGEDYDNNRILAAMAKMEKRRERFKEPIALKNENDSIVPKPELDSIVETMETQQRPARKRRWGGS